MNKKFIAISFFVGFLSMAEEIVWVRLISFLGHSVPQAFSFVLFSYILGIAIGSLVGPKLIHSRIAPSTIIASVLGLSGIYVMIAPELIGVALRFDLLSTIICLFVVFLCAFSKGCIFPLVHHWYTSNATMLGRSLSHVYAANVFGSTLGPLMAGFLLLDYVSAVSALILLGFFEIAIAVVILLHERIYLWKYVLVLIVPLVGISAYIVVNRDYINNYIMLEHGDDRTVNHIIENKHGIIFTLTDKNNIDAVYGGNVYDGMFNVDLISDANGISRAYILAAIKPAPKKILVIGLSSGSWVRVLAAMPGVESIEIVEINQGYADLARKYDGYEDIVNDPRIKITYTDGRMVVKKKIELGEKYDLVLMNNTWHWRAYSTNLLSVDFMGMLKKVLNPSGVATFNSTNSIDVFYTASQIFKYAYKYSNFIYVSEVDLSHGFEKNRYNLCDIDLKKLGHECSAEFKAAIDEVFQKTFLNYKEYITSNPVSREPELITDDNMIVEYKYGMPFDMSSRW